MMGKRQGQIEELAATWGATEIPDVAPEQVAEPASDPMVVYSLRLPRAVAARLRTAAERRGMRPGWPATIRHTGSWPTNSGT